MTLTLSFGEILTLLGMFAACIGFFGKLMLSQTEKRIADKFETQDKLLSEIKEANRAEADSWKKIERDLMELKIELPRQYVQREDWIRWSGVLDSKMDRFSERLETMNQSINKILQRDTQ